MTDEPLCWVSSVQSWTAVRELLGSVPVLLQRKTLSIHMDSFKYCDTWQMLPASRRRISVSFLQDNNSMSLLKTQEVVRHSSLDPEFDINASLLKLKVEQCGGLAAATKSGTIASWSHPFNKQQNKKRPLIG